MSLPKRGASKLPAIHTWAAGGRNHKRLATEDFFRSILTQVAFRYHFIAAFSAMFRST